MISSLPSCLFYHSLPQPVTIYSCDVYYCAALSLSPLFLKNVSLFSSFFPFSVSLSSALSNWIDKHALNFFFFILDFVKPVQSSWEDRSRGWTPELCSCLREWFSELLLLTPFIFPPLIHSLLSLISVKLSQDLMHPQRCSVAFKTWVCFFSFFKYVFILQVESCWLTLRLLLLFKLKYSL